MGKRGRPRKGWRVLGPYRHYRKWGIWTVDPEGNRGYRSCESEEEAKKLAAEIRKQFPGRLTVEEMLDRYRVYQTAKGNKPDTIEHTEMRLRSWHDLDQAVADVTPSQMERRYQQRQTEVAVDTHRNELAQVKTFWRWLRKNRYVKRSPVEDVEPVGRRKKGKPRLRRGEARRLYAVAHQKAREGDEGALAVLAVLFLGVRASELLEREVRDLDGDLLWIDRGKTDAAERYHELPEPLAGLLTARAKGRKGYLFPGDTKSGHRRKEWLNDATHRLCKLAKVPEITTHGLRGTWATLTTSGGVAAEVVAKELGHTSPEVTREHYIERGAEDRERVKRMLTVLEGGKNRK